MAVAFESVSTKAWEGNGSGETLVIDKPSGLAVGDLMIAHLAETDEDANPQGGWNLPSGWTLLGVDVANSVNNGSYITVQAKVADAGDVAASNFTWTHQSNDSAWTSGSIYRISGHSGIANIQIAFDDSSGATPTFTNTITPIVANSFLLMLIVSNGADAGSGSGYAIATDNPTWTERVDLYGDATSYFGNGDGEGLMLGATATRSATTATGDSSVTLIGCIEKSVCALIVIPPLTSADGNHPILTMESSIFPHTINFGTTASHPMLEMTSEIFEHDTKLTENRWTDTEKGTKTWTDTKK